MTSAGNHSKQAQDGELHNLEQLIGTLQTIDAKDRVEVSEMLEAVGSRSFGPILLLMGIIPASPLSGIPGLPTVAGILIFLVVIQLLVGRHHFWLPQFVLRRTVARNKFDKAMHFMCKPARWVDKFIHPRLEVLTQGLAVYVVALMCAALTFLMPLLELVPFGNTSTGIAISIFGLALIARDGALVLLGSAAFIGACAFLFTIQNPFA